MNLESATNDDALVVALLAYRTSGLQRARLLDLVRARRGFERVSAADLREWGFPALSAAVDSRSARADVRADVARWARDEITVLPYGSPWYPELLLSISDPPLVLFVQGDAVAEVLRKPTIGIVGSRRGDSIGCAFAGEVGREFAQRGGTVVSGLAVGIDGAAHRGALQGDLAGSTVAVLGSGFYSIYPAMNRPLARELVSRGGLLVSQFEPAVKPYPANFLNRNRVIAGLSLGVLVVQAAARSGALVTARCALDAGRELLVVPGGIRDPLFAGSNGLLRVGAVPVTSLDELFESFPVPLAPVQTAMSPVALSSSQIRILNSLRRGEPTPLAAVVPQSGENIHGDLLALELEGFIERLPGELIQVVRDIS